MYGAGISMQDNSDTGTVNVKMNKKDIVGENQKGGRKGGNMLSGYKSKQECMDESLGAKDGLEEESSGSFVCTGVEDNNLSCHGVFTGYRVLG
ncbi:hypothetical protein VNO80_03390 [Phaseolus coccineus]|uniref:Uncharacterized protein n=1 Tax=Phaseolus coccineus TaxID=3886 RepID=A0AAN9NRD1_PHACN